MVRLKGDLVPDEYAEGLITSLASRDRAWTKVDVDWNVLKPATQVSYTYVYVTIDSDVTGKRLAKSPRLPPVFYCRYDIELDRDEQGHYPVPDKFSVKLNAKPTNGSPTTVISARVFTRECYTAEQLNAKYEKALEHARYDLREFQYLYRTSSREKWREADTNGLYKAETIPKCGTELNAINYRLKGMFFFTSLMKKTEEDGLFGSALRIFDPDQLLKNKGTLRLYFADFYCFNYDKYYTPTSDKHTKNHRITVVICRHDTESDTFCRERLKPLDIECNPFFLIKPVHRDISYKTINNVERGVYTEVIYAEDINLEQLANVDNPKELKQPEHVECATCRLNP